MFESRAVPFQVIGGKTCLSAMQVANDDGLRDFVKTFAHCFYFDVASCYYVYAPEGASA